MVTLKTDRLLLRPVMAEDVDAFVAIHEDPEVLRWIGGHPTSGRTGAWRMLAMISGHWNLRGYGPWAVVEKATNEVIGRVGLWNPEGWPGIELGWVVRQSRWRHGFATEAASAALRWAWDHVETDHIISMIRADNLRSIRVAEKLGEHRELSSIEDGVEVLTYGIYRNGG